MRFLKGILYLCVLIVAASCATSKDIVYFQDIDKVKLEKLTTEYQAIIKKDDRLTIIVSGPDKSVTAPYNLTLNEMGGTSGGGYSANPEQVTLGYLVDSDGNISFPILGTIHVEGMTRGELERYLTSEIGKDVKDPIVYVAFRNYKISVLGEVKNPGTYTMDSEKVNILQALSRAGDLTLTAKRDGILLLREENGKTVYYDVNLKDSHTLDSPYFFLQQNDVIYVPASPSRVASATTATGIWSVVLSSITTALAVVSMVLAVSK